jgi:hypothetical protein
MASAFSQPSTPASPAELAPPPDVVAQELDHVLGGLEAPTAPLHGPSAEGVTLYGGLESHEANGQIARVIDEAIDFLSSGRDDTANGE